MQTNSVNSPDNGFLDKEKLFKVIAETLEIDAGDFDMDTDLHQTGRLDSIAIVSLVAFIEDELRCKLPVDAIVPDNFSTARRITQLVQRSR